MGAQVIDPITAWRDHAAKAATQQWALLIASEPDLEVWIAGCEHARDIAPVGAVVFSVDELAEIFRARPRRDELVFLALAKQTFPGSVVVRTMEEQGGIKLDDRQPKSLSSVIDEVTQSAG